MRGYLSQYMNDMVSTFKEGLPASGDIITGQKTVAAAGTPEQIKTGSAPLRGGLWITGVTGGELYVGRKDAPPSATSGFVVKAYSPAFIEADEINEIWLDCSADGTSCSFFAL